MKYFFKYFAAASAGASLFILCSCVGDDESVQNAPEEVDDGSVIGLNMKAEPVISYCLPRYMTDAESRTTWEILSGEEAPYGHLILRTEPKRRAGMYFFVMFNSDADEIGLACTFELSVQSTDNPHARTYTFTVPETHSVFREVKLGITGGDWPDASARVNAWKLVVKSPSGKILTQKQSWLWSAKGMGADFGAKQSSDAQVSEKESGK